MTRDITTAAGVASAFGHGELRLVILHLLTHNASHGYELIKEIETLTQGNYTPSPVALSIQRWIFCRISN